MVTQSTTRLEIDLGEPAKDAAKRLDDLLKQHDKFGKRSIKFTGEALTKEYDKYYEYVEKLKAEFDILGYQAKQVWTQGDNSYDLDLDFNKQEEKKANFLPILRDGLSKLFPGGNILANLGKLGGIGVAAVAITSIAGFVKGMFNHSKIMSTYGDAFTKIFGHFADLILITFLPLINPVLRWLIVTVRPKVDSFSKWLQGETLGIDNIYIFLGGLLGAKIGLHFIKKKAFDLGRKVVIALGKAIWKLLRKTPSKTFSSVVNVLRTIFKVGAGVGRAGATIGRIGATIGRIGAVIGAGRTGAVIGAAAGRAGAATGAAAGRAGAAVGTAPARVGATIGSGAGRAGAAVGRAGAATGAAAGRAGAAIGSGVSKVVGGALGIGAAGAAIGIFAGKISGAIRGTPGAIGRGGAAVGSFIGGIPGALGRTGGRVGSFIGGIPGAISRAGGAGGVASTTGSLLGKVSGAFLAGDVALNSGVPELLGQRLFGTGLVNRDTQAKVNQYANETINLPDTLINWVNPFSDVDLIPNITGSKDAYGASPSLWHDITTRGQENIHMFETSLGAPSRFRGDWQEDIRRRPDDELYSITGYTLTNADSDSPEKKINFHITLGEEAFIKTIEAHRAGEIKLPLLNLNQIGELPGVLSISTNVERETTRETGRRAAGRTPQSL